MRKLHKKWFWKTLKGYKVVIATPTKDYIVIHRPFRSPFVSEYKPMHNTKLFAYYDEMAVWPPEVEVQNERR